MDYNPKKRLFGETLRQYRQRKRRYRRQLKKNKQPKKIISIDTRSRDGFRLTPDYEKKRNKAIQYLRGKKSEFVAKKKRDVLGWKVWNCLSLEEQLKKEKEWTRALIAEELNMDWLSGCRRTHREKPTRSCTKGKDDKQESMLPAKGAKKEDAWIFDTKLYNERLRLSEDVYNALEDEIYCNSREFWLNSPLLHEKNSWHTGSRI